MVKLLPALDVVFEVKDEFIEVLVVHVRFALLLRELKGGGLEEDQGTAAELAGGDLETAEVDVQIGEREVALLRFLESGDHEFADLHHGRVRERGGQRRCDEPAAAVEREAAAGQARRPQWRVSGRLASGCPFCFDLFHGFADDGEQGGTGEAHAEVFCSRRQMTAT